MSVTMEKGEVTIGNNRRKLQKLENKSLLVSNY